MGIVCVDAGFADRDVTADGERISPSYVRGCIRKFCGGTVDVNYCAFGIFYADQRVFMAGARQVSGGAVVVGHGRTSPYSADVCACAAIELSHTESAGLGDDYFS